MKYLQKARCGRAEPNALIGASRAIRASYIG
jgi:hypothetical protein